MNGTGEQHPNSSRFAPVDQQQWGNTTFPLGAHYDRNDVTFAVYSRRNWSGYAGIQGRPSASMMRVSKKLRP